MRTDDKPDVGAGATEFAVVAHQARHPAAQLRRRHRHDAVADGRRRRAATRRSASTPTCRSSTNLNIIGYYARDATRPGGSGERPQLSRRGSTTTPICSACRSSTSPSAEASTRRSASCAGADFIENLGAAAHQPPAARRGRRCAKSTSSRPRLHHQQRRASSRTGRRGRRCATEMQSGDSWSVRYDATSSSCRRRSPSPGGIMVPRRRVQLPVWRGRLHAGHAAEDLGRNQRGPRRLLRRRSHGPRLSGPRRADAAAVAGTRHRRQLGGPAAGRVDGEARERAKHATRSRRGCGRGAAAVQLRAKPVQHATSGTDGSTCPAARCSSSTATAATRSTDSGRRCKIEVSHKGDPACSVRIDDCRLTNDDYVPVTAPGGAASVSGGRGAVNTRMERGTSIPSRA